MPSPWNYLHRVFHKRMVPSFLLVYKTAYHGMLTTFVGRCSRGFVRGGDAVSPVDLVSEILESLVSSATYPRNVHVTRVHSEWCALWKK